MKRQKPSTPSPVRAALRPESSLLKLVRDGLGAMKEADRQRIDADVRPGFSDSLDLDEASKPGNEQANRWDYLLGYEPNRAVVAVEPHSANSSEVSVVIHKKKRASEHLRPHLRDGVRITKWLWVSSGPVNIVPFEKKKLLLDQNGIQLVGRVLQKKHLT